jgi:hypothetical protein
LLLDTGWLPADELRPEPGLGLGLLAGSVRELLFGSGTIEQRFDRFVVAYETAFRRPPRWETITLLLSIAFPDDHVLVDLASFRKQVKTLGSKGTLPQRPSGAAYARCLNAARLVASKLIEHGQVPQDLFDVHDFIRFTMKAAPPMRRPKAVRASKKKTSASEAEDLNEPAVESA